MVLDPPLLVEHVQCDLKMAFTCKCKGELTKYIGSKFNFTQSDNGMGHISFTQPVLVQKLEEEYKPPDGPVFRLLLWLG